MTHLVIIFRTCKYGTRFYQMRFEVATAALCRRFRWIRVGLYSIQCMNSLGPWISNMWTALTYEKEVMWRGALLRWSHLGRYNSRADILNDWLRACGTIHGHLRGQEVGSQVQNVTERVSSKIIRSSVTNGRINFKFGNNFYTANHNYRKDPLAPKDKTSANVDQFSYFFTVKFRKNLRRNTDFNSQ